MLTFIYFWPLMSFLYPWFLTALSFLAIPLIIHLFDFRRQKTIYFTNVRFLTEVVLRVNKGLKIKHLLVLIARMLFLLFLVLAFAQPIVNSKQSLQGSTKSISSIYVDNSLSMQSQTGEGDLLQSAFKIADGIINDASSNSKFQFIDNSFLSSDQLLLSRDKFKDRLTELSMSNISRSGLEVYEKQKQNLTRATGSPVGRLFWMSDFQKSSFKDLSQLKVDTSIQLNLIPLRFANQRNIYIDSVWLNNPFLMLNESNELMVKIFNSGNEPIEDFMLKFFVDNIQVSSATVSILAGQFSIAKLSFSIRTASTKLCKLVIDDQPVTFDNDYFFVLNATPNINIVSIVNNSNGSIEKVFSNESFFKSYTYSFNTIDYGRLKSAQLIVIEGVDKINSLLWDYLSNHLKNGGTLLLLPSNSLDQANFKTNFKKYLGYEISLNSNLDRKDSQIAIEKPDIQNPFFYNIFESIKDNLDLPNALPTVTNLPGSKILKLKNDAPFLTEMNKEKGKVFLLASPLDDQFTNLHRHALFVPIMYKIATLSVGEQELLSIPLGQNNIKISLDQQPYEDLFSLSFGEKEFVPEQKIIGNTLIFNLPKETLDPGYYLLKYRGNIIKTLAFNHNNTESKLDSYSAEDLKKQFKGQKNVKVIDEKYADEAVQNIQEQDQGVSLWKYCLILSLFFLALEVAFIRWL